MTKRMNRTFGVILSAVVAVFCIAATVLPVRADYNHNMITLVCKSGDTAISDMNWNIYLAAENKGTAFVLAGDFSEYPVSLDDLSASGIQSAADTLASYAVADKLAPALSGHTGEDGCISFLGLENGVYLIVGEPVTIGNNIYTASASLIEFNGEDIVVSPKFEIDEIPEETKTEYTVEKIWKNDEDSLAERPAEIELEVYLDGELCDTVALNESNNWKYSWESESGLDIVIKEKNVADNYTVEYKKNGAVYSAVNTYKDTSGSEDVPPEGDENTPPADDENNPPVDDGNTPPADDENVPPEDSETSSGNNNKNPQLPQTGLLWWPVPVLAFVGILFVVLGMRLKRSGKQ